MTSYEARFASLGRLFGAEALSRLRRAHVAVIGLGGVGSWAVEALARSGIGELTLVDLDDICISNTNRQLHALDGAWGQPKVEVLAARVKAIHPECQIHEVRAFLTHTNAQAILAPNFDYVLDAIDSPSKKCLIIARCRERGIPVMTVGASAGRCDPLAIQVKDLALSSHDRLLQEIRKKLRVRYAFPRKGPFGVLCVCSAEPPVFPHQDGSVGGRCEPGTDRRMDCQTGFGTAGFVTGTFGLVAAGQIVCGLLDRTVSATGCSPCLAAVAKK